MKSHVADGRHRSKDIEITNKHGEVSLGTLRRIYGKTFAAGHPDEVKLSDVILKLNTTSLGQLQRDHDTGHLNKKIAKATADVPS